MNMKRIFKYEVKIEDEQVLALPSDAEILHFGLQSGVPYIWVKLDPKELLNPEKPLNRRFKVVGTGHVFSDEFTEYIGTVIGHEDVFVWHLFEIKETDEI